MQFADANFQRDGFAFIPNLLTHEYQNKLKSLVPEILKNAAQLEQKGEYLMFLQDDIPALDKLFRAKSLLAKIKSATGLTGEIIKPLSIRIWNRCPGDPGTSWHQDARFTPSDSLAAFSLWVPLQDINSLNGPLMFIPGSHRQCLLKQPQLSNCSPTGVEGKNTIVASPMKYGDATIHDSWIVHGSAGNCSNTPRKALIINWLFRPLELNKVPVLYGHLHPKEVNYVRAHNAKTLQKRIQIKGIGLSPTEWLEAIKA
jgi:ectoine hydroxylase-related dioxygenase (phytanoyl-CoA dioxygenase family)